MVGLVDRGVCKVLGSTHFWVPGSVPESVFWSVSGDLFQGTGFGRFWRGLFQSILDFGWENGILWNRPLQNLHFGGVCSRVSHFPNRNRGYSGTDPSKTELSQLGVYWGPNSWILVTILGFSNPIIWNSRCPMEEPGSALLPHSLKVGRCRHWNHWRDAVCLSRRSIRRWRCRCLVSILGSRWRSKGKRGTSGSKLPSSTSIQHSCPNIGS